ncbi:DUF2161 family putative PD-(D/E)XK-type phosphodiesterase [Paenibacillus sp. SC116]|uniref:DUF2161 family putative PD-(D/E)XK-type phosphodiesterase n=1 Tax=Paenibacillus sp. SC116 TaxID=2968986 RepID=UPI00215B5D07|nr:DUF2161 family putative PD-(D/E)XK-type phosphodiesterase [Paenibacillus sp. SC116]MCR8843730.1 DUF2161 family putative PD-(D/E)XK-type phosphodiesterase [Paenibacillus sp. SC116]
MTKRQETELYAPLKQYWEQLGYEVRAEVRHCDIVAIHPHFPEQPVIVEMKASANLTLLLQALDRQKSAAHVFIAIEAKRGKQASQKRLRAVAELCRRIGIGFLTVTLYARKPAFVELLTAPYGWEQRSSHLLYTGASVVVYEQSEDNGDQNVPVIPPKKPIAARQAKLIREFSGRSGDYNVGGSTKRPLVTAYREKALRVALALQQGQSKPVRVKEASGIGDAAAILRHNYYGWYSRIERGQYALTKAGEAALLQYAEIVDL